MMPLLLPLLLAAAAANAPKAVAPGGNEPGPVLRDIKESQPEAVAFAGTRLCLATLAHPGNESRGKLNLWVAEKPDAPARSFSYALAQLGDAAHHEAACGVEFRQFIELSKTLCTDSDPAPLATETALSWRILPEPMTRFGPGIPSSASYWDRAEEAGCARIVTSPDGSARVWTTDLERIDEGEAIRGHAYLQWRTSEGRVVVARAPGELHLDTIIDGIELLPGDEPLWLVTGLRSYVDTYVGDLPRRFASVLALGDDGSIRVETGFGGKEPLLLRAKTLNTGKFRHDPLARRRLVFDRERKRLVLVGITEKMTETLVARWDGTRFVVVGRRFGDIARADGWAVPKQTVPTTRRGSRR